MSHRLGFLALLLPRLHVVIGHCVVLHSRGRVLAKELLALVPVLVIVLVPVLVLVAPRALALAPVLVLVLVLASRHQTSTASH